MTVVLDTSVLVAFVNPRDPRHAPARRLMERCATGGLGAIVHPLRTGREELGRAVALHFKHFDRGLRATDCIRLTLAEDLRAPIASLDPGFDGPVARLGA